MKNHNIDEQSMFSKLASDIHTLLGDELECVAIHTINLQIEVIVSDLDAYISNNSYEAMKQLLAGYRPWIGSIDYSVEQLCPIITKITANPEQYIPIYQSKSFQELTQNL